jgi:hypothetical protein
VVAGLVIRLVGLSEPFVDIGANWHESDVATIARNFVRDGYDICYPRVAWTGTEPGYVGTEFPSVPLTAAVLYRWFAIHEAIGRSISIAAFSMAMLAFYRLMLPGG